MDYGQIQNNTFFEAEHHIKTKYIVYRKNIFSLDIFWNNNSLKNRIKHILGSRTQQEI